MRKKYFAIRYSDGEEKIIHDIWYNVQSDVTGVSNITFKSFDTYIEASDWLGKEKIPFRKPEDPLERDKLYLFVDGSYQKDNAGWGWVAVLNDLKIGEDFGIVVDQRLMASRNIAGELQATQQVVEWYMKNLYPKYLKPTIVHDYAGIGNWALGYWDTNSEVSNLYRQFMFKYDGNFNFEKIDGHTGNIWNDYADKLASQGISYHLS